MVRAVTPLRRPAPATSPIAAADLAAAARLAEFLAAEEAVGTNSPTMGQSDPAAAQTEAIWDALGVLEAKDFDVSIPTPVPLWRRREAQIGGLAALAACLVGAIWIYGQTGVRVFATGAGERRVVALADGSQLELNTRSRLEVRVSARRRWARLVEGEALFTVATRPDHQPFTVEAGGAPVRLTRDAAGNVSVTEVIEKPVQENVPGSGKRGSPPKAWCSASTCRARLPVPATSLRATGWWPDWRWPPWWSRPRSARAR